MSGKAGAGTGKKREMAHQLVRFNLVGMLNTGVDFAVFMVLSQFGVFYGLAQVVSYSCGVVNSYLWNRHWTFGRTEKMSLGEAGKFLIINMISLGASLLFLFLFHDWLGLTVSAAKVMATLVSVVINFIGNRFWVFNRS